MLRKGFMILVLMLVAASGARAVEVPFARSCYAPLGGVKVPINEALFVVVDETVGFDKNFAHQVRDMVLAWLAPGRAVEVMRFSAGVRQHYTEIVTGGRLDPEPSEEMLSRIPIRQKNKVLACLKGNRRHRGQAAYAKGAVKLALEKIMGAADKRIAHSDIIYNIKLTADYIRAYPARRKVVLFVSDMFENSSITSFYSKGKVRHIRPGRELQKVAQAGMQADFGDGVTVYVMGLGYFWSGDGARRERYLDPARKAAIVHFWQRYFKQGHAKIGEIGHPDMLGSLQ